MIETIITVFIVYLIYYFVSVSKYDKNGYLKSDGKKNNKKKDNDKKINAYKQLPNEAKYFLKKYNVDLDKINFRGFLKIIGLIFGIDVTIVLFFVLILFDTLVWQVLTSILLIIPVYLVSLKFLGSYFKKKGLIKDV